MVLLIAVARCSCANGDLVLFPKVAYGVERRLNQPGRELQIGVAAARLDEERTRGCRVASDQVLRQWFYARQR